jgi:hypothetical protein
MLKKSKDCCDGLLKVILVRAQKEEEISVEKCNLVREYITNNKQNFSRNMVIKAIIVILTQK